MGDREPKRNRGMRSSKLRQRSASSNSNNVAHADYTNHWLPALTLVILGSLSATMRPADLSIMQSAPKWFDAQDLEWLFTDMSFTNSNASKSLEFDSRKSLGLRFDDYNTIVERNTQPAILCPLLTETLPNLLNRTPGSDIFPSTSRSDDPSLLDYEAIDIFWRRDIDAEKGAPWTDQQLTTYDQSERDIQVLSEKMFRPSFGSDYQYPLSIGSASPFSDSENAQIWAPTRTNKVGSFWQFHDIGNVPTSSTSSDSGCPSSDDCDFEANSYRSLLKNANLNRETSSQPRWPTHQKLERSPRDVDPNQLSNEYAFHNASFLPVESPIVQNVSLFSADIHPQNETDTSFETMSQVPDADDYLYTDLEADPNLTPFDPQLNGEAFNALFGTTANMPANGEEFAASFTPPTESYSDAIRSETEFATSYLDNIMNSEPCTPPAETEKTKSEWNEEEPCSSQTSSSSSGSPNDFDSRFFDKLAPMVDAVQSEQDKNFLANRGRQSVDEQLARMHNLPFTPLEITNWSFQELQRNVRTITLTEIQKELIRKIRRRGKNKVAARACRKRKESLFRYDTESDFCDPMDENELREEALERQRELLEALTLQWKEIKRSV